MARIRKSEQKRRQRWKKHLLYGIGGLVTLALALLAGGYCWLVGYISGDAFRTDAENGLAESLGREGRVSIPQPFELEGASLGLPRLELAMADGSCRLNVGKARAEFELWPLANRCLSIPRMTVARLELQTQPGFFTIPFSELFKTGTRRGAFTPENFLIGPIAIERGDFIFENGEDTYSICGTRVELAPLAKDYADWSASFRSGKWKSPYPLIRDVPLHSAVLSSRKGVLKLTDARFLCTPGEVRLQAFFSPDKRKWSVQSRVDNADVEQLLTEDWVKRLSGRLYGKALFQGDLDGLRKAEGDLTLHEGKLTALPVLDKLSIPGGGRFRDIPLNRASAAFSYPYSDRAMQIENAVLIDPLAAESNGLFRMRGRIIVGEGGRLKGTLLVGIADEVFSSFPQSALSALDSLFNAKGEAGFRWVNVNLSGTIDSPQEDFSVRALSLLGRGTLRSIEDTAGDLLKTVAPSLSPDGAAPKEEAKPSLLEEAADEASGILKKGLKSFF